VSSKHTIVPRNFTAADVGSCFDPEKFQRVTARQARALAQDGRIRQLGDSGRIWQLTEESWARPSYETGDGRVSLEVPLSIRTMLECEIRRRPAWGVTI
jgi:hypothetical protein